MRGKILFLCLLLLCAGTVRAAPLSEVAVGTTARSLVLVLHARGVQIYECRALPGEADRYEWAFQAPEADLFEVDDKKIGRHYAGPTWELTDGSKVVGKLKAKADAPGGKGIPWLLLDAAGSGPGVLGNVVSIQRTNTVGGLPPAEPADAAHAGQIRRVDYTATYLFYVPKP